MFKLAGMCIRKLSLICVLTCIGLCAMAQLKNPGFELGRDTLPSLPQNWSIGIVAGYTVNLDGHTAYAGKSSLKINGKDTLSLKTVITFAQKIDYEVAGVKRIKLTAYIKTNNAKGTAAIFCRVFDGNDKRIAFQNSEMQKISITGTTDWKKYTLLVTLPPGTKQIAPGGYVSGGGEVWFDDLEIADVPIPTTPPSAIAKSFIDEVIGVIKAHAIYADSVNWVKVQKDVDELSKGLVTVDDAQPVITYIIDQLHAAGDVHTFMQSKEAANDYATRNVSRTRPEAKLLPGDIGYITVPGFGSTSDTAVVSFATRIQMLIQNLDTQNNIKGWIVDLRSNNGGNMWPMIAGLGPLIGNGTLGYFVVPSLKAKAEDAWFYKDGVSGNSTSRSAVVKPYYELKKPDQKIAVLVSPRTASSGEMTALTFTGKPNTRLFGQATGGYTTGNRNYKLSTGQVLVLASTLVADRTHKRYFGKIIPDVVVEPSQNDELILKAAMEWINAN